MRLRYRSVTYSVGDTPSSLERHYRELREAMLRAGQQYGLQPAAPWRPPIDILETPAAIQVKVELAGVREEDFEITLYDNALVVSGHREDDSEQGESVYYHEAQVRYGPFRADVLLPDPVRREAVTAVYENGFLRVCLPKPDALAPRPFGADGPARAEDGAPGDQAPPRAGRETAAHGGAARVDAPRRGAAVPVSTGEPA